MTDYRITCRTLTRAASGTHGHITAVGIAGQSGTYSVQSIYNAIDNQDRFYTVSPSTSRTALVGKATCCGVQTLRTGADAVTDNNLDNLPSC